MSSAYVKFYPAAAELCNGGFNANADSFYLALSNSLPAQTDATYSQITELASGNGYVTGGTIIGSTACSQVSGTATMTGSNVVFTATGSMGPFEYVVNYDETSASKYLLNYWSYGSAVTLTSGETFTVNLAGGIFTLT
jgi:hypothetical protein